MSHLTLEHVKINDLPYGWVKQLPPAQTVTVTLVVENIEPQPTRPEQEIIEPPSYDIGQAGNVPEDRKPIRPLVAHRG